VTRLIKIGDKEIRITGRFLRIARLEGDGFEFLSDPEALLAELRNSPARIDLFTFMQRAAETTANFKYPMEWDNYAAVRITTFDNWWNQQIGFKARNKAKQAQKKGVVIREVPFDDNLVKGIWEIYNECPVRQGRRFTHFGKDLETVYREEATFLQRAIFIGAYLEEKLIGFVKMIVDETGTQAATMNIISMISQRDKAPTNALVAQAVRSCADRGISYFIYSQFAYGRKIRSSVTDFKERNGMKQIDVPRYYVPLTAYGALAWRLGLHHELKDRLPETVMDKLRDLRSGWYERKFQTPKEAM
jgi:hypothetical protein